VCVAKLWDINSELAENQGFVILRHNFSFSEPHLGFLETLVNLLSDSNPMVVANAVAALSEIQVD
jgi:vesicle coat complex subunit